MTTAQIQHWETLDDNVFLETVKIYKRRGNKVDHLANLLYLQNRLNKHKMLLIAGCCNEWHVVGYDYQE